MPDDLVTQSEAARQTGKTRQAIYDLIRRCRIATYGRDRLVSLSEVKTLKRGKDGRPRKRPSQR